MTNKPDTIEIKEWFVPGNGMMYNTYGLEPDHPMHPYNQIIDMGLQPEDYGITHPYKEQFGNKTRGQLINEIIALRKEIVSFHRLSAMF